MAESSLFDYLTDDCITEILAFVPVQSFVNVALVCKQFEACLADENLWRTLCRRNCIEGTQEELESAVDETGDSVQWRALYRRRGAITLVDCRHHEDLALQPVDESSKKVDLKVSFSKSGGSEYKGVQLKTPIPVTGCTFVEFELTFEGDASDDHFSLGIADDSFPTDRLCYDGWGKENHGIGWYSSNGAVYIYGEGGVTCSIMQSGSKLGMLLDRTEGTLSFFYNGKEEARIQRKQLSSDAVYITCIIIARCEVKIARSAFGNTRKTICDRLHLAQNDESVNSEGDSAKNDSDDDSDDDSSDDDEVTPSSFSVEDDGEEDE